MRLTCSLFCTIIFYHSAYTQTHLSPYEYEANKNHPFGKLNPKAPNETGDYALLIGVSDCKSLARNSDGEWPKDSVDMIWRYKYIINGMAVQDESFRTDETFASSIRQYDKEAKKWYITYFSSTTPSSSPSTWMGDGMKEGKIILYKKQKAPNGMEGFYKITFDDITESDFSWKGEWVDIDETFSYPTWYITCKKRH